MTETQVKTYKSGKDFEKDSKKMLVQGWRPVTQSGVSGHVNLRRTTARVMTGGFLLGGASRSKDQIVVTWERDSDAPREKTFLEKIKELSDEGHRLHEQKKNS